MTDGPTSRFDTYWCTGCVGKVRGKEHWVITNAGTVLVLCQRCWSQWYGPFTKNWKDRESQKEDLR